VFGRGSGLPVASSKLRNSGRRPFSSVVVPSVFRRWKPETKSYTSLEMAVFWQTMMKQGGTWMPFSCHRPKVCS